MEKWKKKVYYEFIMCLLFKFPGKSQVQEKNLNEKFKKSLTFCCFQGNKIQEKLKVIIKRQDPDPFYDMDPKHDFYCKTEQITTEYHIIIAL